MVDLTTKEWVHIVCINWTNEIWFETDDIEMKMFGGKLNMEKFDLLCYICKRKQGSCIQCDFDKCLKSFHVTCAIRENLIKSSEDMEA